jgi:hypothetical protein
VKSLLIISDGHSNSTVGLARPSIELDDGDKVDAGIVRRFIWQTYTGILDKATAKAREYGSELYGLLNGDAIELAAKHASSQVITINREEAGRIAQETYEPFFERCKGVFVTRGTEAHTGLSATAEETLAANFTNTIRNPDTNRASWWWLPLELDGVPMDICHHPKGGGSGRPMNRLAGIMRIASDTLFEYADAGKVPPQLVIRSHLHGYRDSKDAFRTRAIITPAMSLLTAHTHRIGINASEPIGGLLITCHEGKYHVEPLLTPVRPQSWMVL